MRFGAAISLLCAVAAVAPAAFAMPVASDATDGLEARAYDAEVADLLARSDFDEATSLLARAVTDVLGAREDPPRYHKNDPINGKKPAYSAKDPNPPPKSSGGSSNGPRRPRELAEVDDLWARDVEEVMAREDPPPYRKHDSINGRKPAYSAKDPNPPPKYRQHNPHVPDRESKHRPSGGSSNGPRRPRELAEVDDLWAREELEDMWARDVEEVMAREDPPRYHKNDPINGKKPAYSAKDPNPPPKYRQHNPHVPNRHPVCEESASGVVVLRDSRSH
ncbi:uncharacterized protein B0H18DRAFT_955455 [Fomitopsis serialis]|uniref:uncharacterized protein n=1 Tax=Fomitopsis serialis TaxID=139415 RepID=UPI0020078D03|nr:uncharacterized protein B0H18DRAFT_955455 [Neoantrodia serialis]KAH9924565.1 hypothetical protein B0H18DRAFT_955455 [Neoantrodia serialis]